MATHSSTLAWEIPWTEEPDGLQSLGSLRVGCDWGTALSLFTFMHWRWKWQPTPVFLPGNPRDGGAWWAAVYGVTQSWTRLKQLSSSSSSSLGLKGCGRCGMSWLTQYHPVPLSSSLFVFKPTYLHKLLQNGQSSFWNVRNSHECCFIYLDGNLASCNSFLFRT